MARSRRFHHVVALGWSVVGFAAWALYPVLPARLVFHVEHQLIRIESDLSA